MKKSGDSATQRNKWNLIECPHLANFRAEILPSVGEILCRKMERKNGVVVSAPVARTAHFTLRLLQVIDLGNSVRSVKSTYHDVPSWQAFVTSRHPHGKVCKASRCCTISLSLIMRTMITAVGWCSMCYILNNQFSQLEFHSRLRRPLR